MCHTNKTRKKYRLADFFHANWEEYMESPARPVEPEQLKAANAMMACRTAALGVDVYHCRECQKTQLVYHSCNNRFCPTCGYMATQKWAEKIKSQMLDMAHHHVVVSLPSVFRPLARQNRRQLYNIIFRSSARAFMEWFVAKHGVEPGIMSVLHTFGDDKKYHVHVHMILTAGGLNKESNQYTSVDTKKYFVNFHWFANKKFRPIFTKELLKAYEKGEITSGFSSIKDFEAFIDKTKDKNWRLNIEPPLRNVEAIVKYTGRYTRRPCLSEYKIRSIEGEYISFEHKDYKNGKNKKPVPIRTKTMHYRDFFPRLLQHVPLKNFRIVRYYGIYSRMKDLPCELTYQGRCQEGEVTNEAKNEELTKYEDLLCCKGCNKKMGYIFTMIDKRKRALRIKDGYTISGIEEAGARPPPGIKFYNKFSKHNNLAA